MIRQTRDRALLFGIVIVAFALHWWGIARTNLWLDETASVDLARLPLPALLEDVRHSPVTPGYYLLLKAWIALFGSSPTALRSLSALAAIAVIVLAYRLGQSLFGTRTALLGAALLALSPVQLYFAQEARLYMLSAALATAVLLAYVSWRRTVISWNGETARASGADRWRSGGALVLASVALICTYPLGVLMLVALWFDAVPALWRARERGDVSAAARSWLLMQTAIALAGFPLLLRWDPSSALATQGWRQHIGPLTASLEVERYALTQFRGIYVYPFEDAQAWLLFRADGARWLPHFGNILRLIWVGPVTLLALSACLIVAWRRGAPAARRLLAWALLVTLGVLAILSSRQGLDLPRYALFASPCLMLLVAEGLLQLRGRAQRLAASVLAVTLVIGLVQYTLVPSRDTDYRQVARLLGQSAQAGDRVSYRPWYAFSPLRYYVPTLQLLPRDASPDSIPDAVLASAVPSPGRRWLVVDYRAPDVFRAASDSLARRGERTASDTMLPSGIRVIQFRSDDGTPPAASERTAPTSER